MIDQTKLTPRQRLVFPLDVPDWKSAEKLVSDLKGSVGCFKLGLELFLREGPQAMRSLVNLLAGEASIFLDLKLHDIPATVAAAMAAVSGLGADLLTVHASDTGQMIRAAKEQAGDTKILAVTVLTSINPADHQELAEQYRQPGELVLYRARLARKAGCDGFICSGQEAKLLRDEFGLGPLIITPGIRPEWSLVAGDDQARVVTPKKAIADGADMLVVGRPIRTAPNPAEAAQKVTSEIAAALV
jgi:orotidine-5'-phosphate decarboxylase